MKYKWKKSLLLRSDEARRLYAAVAELPLIDYHNHLSLEDIRKNRRYTNVYDLWVRPDPYKHRAMRMCGVPEELITGSASDREKFIAWCDILPRLLGNPLYIWSRMELETVFGITDMPDRDCADALYDRCNRFLQEREVTPRWFVSQFQIEKACPCVSLLDDLASFQKEAVFVPSLRGDDVLRPTKEWIRRLSSLTGRNISDLASFCQAVDDRLENLFLAGCRFADLALDDGFVFYPDDGQNPGRFLQVLKGGASPEDRDRLASWLIVRLGASFVRLGLVLQLHMGAQRYTSTKLRATAGAAGGFAAMGNSVSVSSLTRLLDAMDQGSGGLPKIVLFSLNPSDDAMISTLSGSYSKDGVAGLITQGPAWWWCDHQKGMRQMLTNTASYGVLSNFIGMTTDSRSFLSFVRHDYFRRVLCDLLSEMAEREEVVCGFGELEALAKKLCYENAKYNWR